VAVTCADLERSLGVATQTYSRRQHGIGRGRGTGDLEKSEEAQSWRASSEVLAFASGGGMVGEKGGVAAVGQPMLGFHGNRDRRFSFLRCVRNWYFPLIGGIEW
jgi:hypothetical protein